MYRELFGNNAGADGGADGGGDVPAVPQLVASAGSVYVREEPGSVTFDAFVVGIVKGFDMVRLVPLNVGQTLSQPGAGATFSRATQDGRAIRLHYKQQRAPANPDNPRAKRAVTLVEVGANDARMATVADLHEMTISMLVPKGQLRENVLPPLHTFVRVVNFRLTMGDKKEEEKAPPRFRLPIGGGGGGKDINDERVFANASALDPSAFAELNALPVSERLAAVFHVCKQTLPSVAPLMPLVRVLHKATYTSPAGTPDRPKDEKALLRAVVPPMPVVMLTSTREWKFGSGTIKFPTQQPLVIPQIGLPKEEEMPEGTFFASYLIDPGRPLYTPSVDGKQPVLRGRFDFEVYQRRGTHLPREQFRLHEVTLFQDKFEGLGVTHYAWVDALLQQTPVPFQLLAGIDMRETVSNGANFSPQTSCKADAVFGGEAIAVEWLLKETLAWRGIPVTRAFVAGRYGDNADYVALKMPAGGKVVIPEAWKKNCLNNRFQHESALEAFGVVAFDAEAVKRLPTEEEASFWALPLFALRQQPPMVQRVDPRCPLPPADHPMAVSLTPAEGDAFVRAALPAPPAAAIPNKPVDVSAWFQATKEPMPYFLFFATRKLPSAAAAAAAAVPNLWHDPPLAGGNDALLPRDMNALRTKLIRDLVENVLPDMKRPREEPASEEADRPAKRARIDGEDDAADEKGPEPAAAAAGDDEADVEDDDDAGVVEDDNVDFDA